jgi:hypothetical protein
MAKKVKAAALLMTHKAKQTGLRLFLAAVTLVAMKTPHHKLLY